MNMINIIDAIDKRMDFSQMAFCRRMYNGTIKISGERSASEVLSVDSRFMESAFITHHQLRLIHKDEINKYF